VERIGQVSMAIGLLPFQGDEQRTGGGPARVGAHAIDYYPRRQALQLTAGFAGDLFEFAGNQEMTRSRGLNCFCYCN
jgi:hypothetical protein